MIWPSAVVLRRRVLELAGLALASCGPKHPAQMPSGEPTCAADLQAGEHQFRAVPELEPPRSHVALELHVTSDRLRSEIERRVPTTLDQARRDIGPAGRVKYMVTRGPFALELRDDRLVASTVIEAQVEVCKDLGPFCITYGRCSPMLSAVASVPLLPGPGFALGRSHVSASVQRGCSIAGFNATPQIEQIAREQSAQAQQRIDRSLPRIDEIAQRVWPYLLTPVALEEGGCLSVDRVSPTVTHPRLEQATYSTSVGIDLNLRWSETCDQAAKDRPAPLPVLETVDKLEPATHLHVALTIPWQQAKNQLSRALQRAAGKSEPIEELRLRPALVGNDRRIAVGLRHPNDSCGGMWLLAEPWWDGAAGELRLRRVVQVPGGEDSAQRLAENRRLLEEQARLTLPLQPGKIGPKLQDLLAQLRPETSNQVDLLLSLEGPEVERVVAAPQGLVTVLTLRGRIEVSAK